MTNTHESESKLQEYETLRNEIAHHQDFSIRIVTYSISVIGGILALNTVVDYTLLAGIYVIFISSQIYLLASAKKIYIITAYLAVYHDKSIKGYWHEHLPKLFKKYPSFFEFRNIAIIYCLISIISPVLFYQDINLVKISIILSLISLILSIVLYREPNKISKYKKYWEENKPTNQQRINGT